jgi:DNA-binding transcriptional LysR family regulator
MSLLSNSCCSSSSLLPSRITSDHPSLYLDLVKSGMGIGLLQSTIIEPELAAGTLEMIDCSYNSHPILYKNYLAYFKRKKQALAPLIDSLLEQ